MFPVDRLMQRGEIRSEEIISQGWAEVIELEGMVGEKGSQEISSRLPAPGF
jgi:hypothetical protein